MAHSCPECDQVCHCGGDIDDLILDYGEEQYNCTHWKQCESTVDEDDDFYFGCDDDDYDFDCPTSSYFYNRVDQKIKNHRRKLGKHYKQRRLHNKRRRFYTDNHQSYYINIFSKGSIFICDRIFADNDLPF